MDGKYAYKWLPVVIEDSCTGCGLCVQACGPACLETRNLIAVLERPDECGSEEHCIAACPEDALYMAWVPCESNQSFGVWRTEEEMKSLGPQGRTQSSHEEAGPQLPIRLSEGKA